MYRTVRRQKRKRKTTRRRTKRQTDRFLNHYDFAYARRDVVNQAVKVTPNIITGAKNGSTTNLKTYLARWQGNRACSTKSAQGIYGGRISNTILTTWKLWKKTIEQIDEQNFKITSIDILNIYLQNTLL